MKASLNIVMIASECVPFAKTGGLADVAGALPQALQSLGHEVIVVLPKYGSINASKFGLRRMWNNFGVWMGGGIEWCAVEECRHKGVRFFFIECEKFFARNGLYHDSDYNDFADNPRRFAFLSRAGLQLCKDLGFKPDVVHAHDWQSALASAYLRIWHWNDPVLGGAASVLTLHNLAYQGKYGKEHYDYLGLGWSNFNPEHFEDHGSVNFLKGGIQYADMVNTVSPTYAEETRTPEQGYGMAPYLNNKGSDYWGILNGVDYGEWNPATDPLIPAHYSSTDLKGKALCKEALQERFQLAREPGLPIVGIVSRLASQKGLDLFASVIEEILANMRVQIVVLGSGDKGLEHFFRELPARYPGRVGSFIGYNNDLAHLIEAGSDFFLMPSIYEPCGLNQLYSLKYGTLPIVRATGGLNDTVAQYDEATGEGTGFKFWEPSAKAIYYTVGWAVSTYFDRPAHLTTMIHRAMEQDFSWARSAETYVHMYRRAMEKRGKL